MEYVFKYSIELGSFSSLFFVFVGTNCLIHSDGEEENTSGGALVTLFGKIQKVISALPQERKNSVTIMIDDVSLMEVAARGSTNLVVDFLHYCHTLTAELVRHVNYCFALSTCNNFFGGFIYIILCLSLCRVVL